jgi:hypothetical protein
MDADEISLRWTLAGRLAPFHLAQCGGSETMANDAFQYSGWAFIDAKMNARFRTDVVTDLCAKAVRAAVDHAAFKNPAPVES